jgi:3alpha(or 20beta)-hydroxysteroid dehydrogenase
MHALHVEALPAGAPDMAYPNTAAYMAGRWGARGVTKTTVLELGRDNIRQLHPPRPRPLAEAAVAAAAGGLAIPRVAEPEEITRMVLFVASDEATFSTVPPLLERHAW